MDVASSAAELVSIFNRAADGATIELAAGDYGAVTLQGHHFTYGITITSKDSKARAVFTNTLDLKDTSGVTVKGVDVIATQLAVGGKDARVGITGSSDITLSDIKIQGHIPTADEGADPLAKGTLRGGAIAGYGYETGLRITNSYNVRITNVEISDLRGGVGLGNAKDTTLSGIDLHDIREGINLHDIRNLVIENSKIYDLNKWQPRGRGDHPDMIQYWGVQSKFGIDGLTIRDNFFLQPAGSKTQTIFGSMHPERSGLTARNFVITGNVIVNAHSNAIRLHDVDGLKLSGNTLLPNADNLDFRSYPSISLGNVTNAVVADNTVMPRWQNGDVLPQTASALEKANIKISNNVIMSISPASPIYWKTVYSKATAWAAKRFGH